jgi:Uma2 family endonuclease
MAIASALSTTPNVAMRSQDNTWDRARWETLPNDGNRYEVIDGVLYLTTAPKFFHQWIIRQLFLLLHAQIDLAGLGITTWSPIGLFMPGCDPVQPDLLVIHARDLGIIVDGRIEGIPALIVEVLSPSHPDLDLRTKREAYARAGVPEYWIVRPATRDVLVCSQPDAQTGDFNHTELFAKDDTLSSHTLPVRVPVSNLFAGAPDTTL